MERNSWSLVVAMGLTVYMATLDLSIVTVALPTLEEDFGTRPSVTEWVALGYMLPLIGCCYPAGAGSTRSASERRWCSRWAASPPRARWPGRWRP
ncbi:MAG: hypothetical protein GEV03_19600 [Streptosporangiales bacterium]|nr:hypothetical protein [Streptosporangiales bacterium]